MNARDVMTSTVRACTPQTTLATAGTAMWESDCGVLPVLDDDRHVIGMITDRDICIAGATKGRPLNAITVDEVMARHVITASESDSIDEIAMAMAAERVHRLPVVNTSGELSGIISLNDIALRAQPKVRATQGNVTYDHVMLALKGVCEHWPREQTETPSYRETYQERTSQPAGGSHEIVAA